MNACQALRTLLSSSRRASPSMPGNRHRPPETSGQNAATAPLPPPSSAVISVSVRELRTPRALLS